MQALACPLSVAMTEQREGLQGLRDAFVDGVLLSTRRTGQYEINDLATWVQLSRVTDADA